MKLSQNFIKKFKNNKRAYYSFIIFSFLFTTSLFAEFIANDKPLLVKYKNQYYFPIIKNIPETTFNSPLKTSTNYHDPYIKNEIANNGFQINPLIFFSYDSINFNLTSPAPSPPSLTNILGTDDNGRDVMARIIYGIRISLIFAITLTFFSLIIGISLGAIQGYFGGICDLALQRFIEIWSSMPVLFLLIILSTIIQPGFFSLLFLMLLFSWMAIISYIRAEFLRLRNFDFVKSAKSLGASNSRIIFKHILPNTTPIILANAPFMLAGSITMLTSLDFLGLGMPANYPSLGELLSQGKNNINATWLGISGFITITLILTILVFIAEGLRDSLDSRK